MTRLLELRWGLPLHGESVLSISKIVKSPRYGFDYMIVLNNRVWTAPPMSMDLMDLKRLHAALGRVIEKEERDVTDSGC